MQWGIRHVLAILFLYTPNKSSTATTMLNYLLGCLDFEQQSIITWQRELTCRPALAPENNGQGEDQKASWLTIELQKLKIPLVQSVYCADTRVSSGLRPNIIAKIPGRTRQTLWIIAHMDVAPPGDPALWETPPFSLYVDGDFLYGRGVEDNQQAIVSALLIAKVLFQNSVAPERSLGFMFVSDEETGMQHGLPCVLSQYPQLLRPDDLILVPDMGNADGTNIMTAEKSCLWLKISVSSQQVQSAPHDENQRMDINTCIDALKQVKKFFPLCNPLFTPPHSTFTIIRPPCTHRHPSDLEFFYLDCRIVPEYDPGEVLSACQRIIADHAEQFFQDYRIEVIHNLPGACPTPEQAEVVQLLRQALFMIRQKQATVCGSNGQTLASRVRRFNFPAVTWATLEPNPHVPNERSSISKTIADAKVMLAMLFLSLTEPKKY